jgi:hypothetical protein
MYDSVDLKIVAQTWHHCRKWRDENKIFPPEYGNAGKKSSPYRKKENTQPSFYGVMEMGCE